MDTIFAMSSGAPPAAIAVMRISGPQAIAAATALCGATLPSPRRASLRRLTNPADGTPLDRALVIIFPGPATATGEDLVELHVHGGRAVVAAVEEALGSIDGLRPALAGEFTRRALLAGIIDLTEAEGLGDLLAAETETQRRAALTSAEGGIRRRVEDWSARLLAISAQVEAQLDFSDEDDVPDDDVSAILAHCATLADDMARLTSSPPVERLKDGIRIVLAGPPNSGKSTLLNAMVERDAAIVSPIAGTTRDRIEAPVSRHGIAYLLIDTAGLTERRDDPIEAIGVDRARAAMATADILLWLGDDPPPHTALWLCPRADMPGRTGDAGPRLALSAKTGVGMNCLWRMIAAAAGELIPAIDELALNQRQRTIILKCQVFLGEAGTVSDLIVVAEYLRLARMELDSVTGYGDTEAMLDALFGKFCIGK